MDILIPIVCVVVAVVLFVFAFITYKKPNELFPMPATSNHNESDSTFWSRFVNFDKFVTTQIIKIVYVVGTAVIIITLSGGFILYATSVNEEPRSMSEVIQGIFAVFITALFSLLIWRVFCELVIVIFKINENLQALRDSKQIVDTEHITN